MENWKTKLIMLIAILCLANCVSINKDRKQTTNRTYQLPTPTKQRPIIIHHMILVNDDGKTTSQNIPIND